MSIIAIMHLFFKKLKLSLKKSLLCQPYMPLYHQRGFYPNSFSNQISKSKSRESQVILITFWP